MTAALDIGSARTTLTAVGKGLQPARDYFCGFDEYNEGFGSHRNNGERHVSILDDHDHVFGEKVRFSAEIPDSYAVKDYQVVVPTAIQLFTLGIPCIYYGTEQAFSGPAQSQLGYLSAEGWKNGGNHGDRYLREAMFGPEHPRAHHDLPIAEATRQSQYLAARVRSLRHERQAHLRPIEPGVHPARRPLQAAPRPPGACVWAASTIVRSACPTRTLRSPARGRSSRGAASSIRSSTCALRILMRPRTKAATSWWMRH